MLAGRRGVQPNLYSRSHVKALPHTTPLAMQLQGVLEDWRSMPFVSMRQNIGAQNPLGVQGVVSYAIACRAGARSTSAAA